MHNPTDKTIINCQKQNKKPKPILQNKTSQNNHWEKQKCNHWVNCLTASAHFQDILLLDLL